jgi:hypothetical protein
MACSLNAPMKKGLESQGLFVSGVADGVPAIPIRPVDFKRFF